MPLCVRACVFVCVCVCVCVCVDDGHIESQTLYGCPGKKNLEKPRVIFFFLFPHSTAFIVNLFPCRIGFVPPRNLACIRIPKYLCKYVYAYLYIYIYNLVYVYTHAGFIDTHTRAICIYICMYTYICLYIYMYIRMCTCLYVHIHL